MSIEHKKEVQMAACKCEAFLQQCGVDPDTVATSKLYELAIVYYEYGPEGVRDYLGTDIGGIEEFVS